MRLIIATNTSSVAAKNALTAFLEAKGWSVWHWYEDLWLLDNVPATATLTPLRNEIIGAIPTLNQILIMTPEGALNHSGLVPPNSVEWLKEHWNARR